MGFQHVGQGPDEILVFLFLKNKTKQRQKTKNQKKKQEYLKNQKYLKENKKFVPVLASFPVAAEQTITTTKTWQKQLKGERIYLVHNSRLHSITTGKSRQQELERPTSSDKRELVHACLCFTHPVSPYHSALEGL